MMPLAGARVEGDEQALAPVGQQHVNGVEQPAKFDQKSKINLADFVKD